jgi:hypothetical protein
MIRLNDALDSNTGNYILPFLWLHGEEENVLRETVQKIEESGIKAFCIEARPHPDFLKRKWWRDLDILIEEAKKRDMKMWILDDSHFPTGFANGEVKNNYLHLQKKFLTCKVLDFFGPLPHAQAIIRYAYRTAQDKLIAVVLGKKTGYEKVDPETLVDITAQVVDEKVVSFDLPKGEWSVMIVTSTYAGGEKETEGYLNPIVSEATDVLIQTIYEAHYEKYKEEFGKTIAGFFSDEPRFGNMHGANGSIGRVEMDLPWRDDLDELLSKELGEECVKYLPLLFIDGGEKGHQMRYEYMDLVSKLYSEHFNQRISEWCTCRGVEYIGHTIEDNNAHSRLGYGAGHFFRAMSHQDMAGIDVVLHQLLPGMDQGHFKSKTKEGWDGEFFHYALGKLGSSLGHQKPKMKGRTMCEVFGAYGWAEGNKLMKWIIDYMLVRGVNYFVPHAFDPKEYPDRDCPPHFYAHGRDPQFSGFRMLMNYTNRLSHLFNGGIHRAPVGIVYHGEAEWSGEYMLLQKPARELTRNQIDFDILPIDCLLAAQTTERGLIINQETFKGLVIPYAEALPTDFLMKLLEFTKRNIPLYWLNQLPVRTSDGKNAKAVIEKLKNSQYLKIVSEEELANTIKQDGLPEVLTDSFEPYLRYYHYEHQDGDIYFFVNEHPYNLVHTKVTLPSDGDCMVYDAMENCLIESNHPLEINLLPFESRVLIFPHSNETKTPYKELKLVTEQSVPGPYEISFASYPNFGDFKDTKILEQLKPVQEIEGYENFAGFIRYEVCAEVLKADQLKLKLEGIAEGVKLWVNNEFIGEKICSPYEFDMTKAIKNGKNQFRMEVSTTLVRERYDYLSQFMIIEPIGINGGVIIKSYSVQ